MDQLLLCGASQLLGNDSRLQDALTLLFKNDQSGAEMVK